MPSRRRQRRSPTTRRPTFWPVRPTTRQASPPTPSNTTMATSTSSRRVGMPELIIGLVVILLLFGAKRVPELARGLGSGVREFKKGTQEGEVEDKKKKEEAKKDEEQLEASKSERDDETKLEEDASVEAEKAEQKHS